MPGGSSFRDRLRVRVCGLLVEDDAILLAQIHSPITESLIWTPPGGELQFGEHLQDCVKREFSEETNLKIKTRNLAHINELVEPPYHALEFYFTVSRKEGEPEIGSDPELSWNQQLLKDLKWIPLDELGKIAFAPDSLLPKLLDWDPPNDQSVF